MRPEISILIRQTMYPRLKDHEVTKRLPAVVGMRKNVFWLDYENIEEGPSLDRHQRSHNNIWEAEMTHALVRHLVRQSVYSNSDIAVLTPYTGQLQKLREKMSDDFEIVLSELDQETLARDGFAEETILSEGEQGNSGSGRKPLEKKLSKISIITTIDNFQVKRPRSSLCHWFEVRRRKRWDFSGRQTESMSYSAELSTACTSSAIPILTPMYLCGLRSFICYRQRILLARLLVFAALATWTRRCKPLS